MPDESTNRTHSAAAGEQAVRALCVLCVESVRRRESPPLASTPTPILLADRRSARVDRRGPFCESVEAERTLI